MSVRGISALETEPFEPDLGNPMLGARKARNPGKSGKATATAMLSATACRNKYKVAERCLNFKFVSLQRTNLKFTYEYLSDNQTKIEHKRYTHKTIPRFQRERNSTNIYQNTSEAQRLIF